MFNQTQKKLALTYAVCFFLFFLVFLVILYTSLVQLMEHQQLEELETYYEQQRHDLFEHAYKRKRIVNYDPNRAYFYYIYSSDDSFVHGDENVDGFIDEIEDIYEDEDVSTEIIKKVEWEGEHLLLLSKPIIGKKGTFQGYIIVGKSITSQYHFFQKMIWLLVGLMIVFTIFIGLLSYYMAGKAMKPIQASFEKQKKFVSDASHELRTPLSIFYSSLDILETDEAERLSPFGKELVSDLKEEAEIMKDLLEKLLFLARYDQNRLEIKNETISLSEMLENIGEKFQRTLPENINFHSEIEKNVHMMGDPKRLNELFYIFLENASQYTKEGTITLRLLTTKSAIKIFVEDTGIGISKEDIPHIFDRFYRGDVARKRDGTGLGLSIAKAIVDEHGGTIQVKSELGKGTSFCIQFPLSKNTNVSYS